MANVIPVTVENPDELLNAGMYGAGAIVRLQSGLTETGAFSNESTAAIITATRLYTLYDQDGTSTTWYRTRYENAGGTVVSDWSPAFQAGDETGGLICSVYDVEQRIGTQTSNDRETILDIIRAVTIAIEGFTGRWFSPRPLAGTKTLTLSPGYDFTRVLRDGRTVLFPRGIRAIGGIGYAVVDQPSTGGSYTSITATDAILPAAGTEGWPSTRFVLREQVGCILRPGLNTIQLTTSSFGWSAVPFDIQNIGVEAVIRTFIGKETATPAVSVGPSGATVILRGMSPEAMAKLVWYRGPGPVA